MSDLTGLVASRQKKLKADEIMSLFLREGGEALHEGNLDQVAQCLYEAQARFNYYGIDIEKYLKTKEV